MHRFTPPRRAALALGLALALGALMPPSRAQTAGDIRITSALALPSVPGARNGGGFLTIANQGKADDRIVGASSPACGHVELHTMVVENDVMRMREVDAIPVAAGRSLRMVPGSGYHLMFMDLKQPLKVGDTVPVRVEFEHAGAVELQLAVEPRERIMGGGVIAPHGMRGGMH